MNNLNVNLQNAIEAKAEKEIRCKIEEIANQIQDEFGHFLQGATIEIVNGEGKLYPYLVQVFKSEPIVKVILKQRMPEYIDREISRLLETDFDTLK